MAWTRRMFLKTLGTASAGATFGSLSTSLNAGCQKPPAFDVLIQNGTVIDGTGAASYRADIGIIGQQIVEIGHLAQKGGKTVIDARGLVVAPGFIDIHSHTDLTLLANPKAESKARQGVTTEVAGQDGSSLAPLSPDMRKRLQDGPGKRYGIEIDWQDFRGLFNRLEQQGIGVNFISFVGQGTIRELVVGQENVPATLPQVGEMKTLVDKAIATGAWGLSSGLEYPPGGFATLDEISELCRTAKSYGVLYATHIRNEDDTLLEAIDEAIATARAAEIGLQISHVKASGRRNWGKIFEVLKKIEQANADGLDIACDRYPYIAYATGLTNLFPLWSRDGGTDSFIERLQDAQQLPTIKEAVLAKVDMLGAWDAVMITSVTLNKNRPFQGKRVSQIVEATQQDPFEFVTNLLIEERASVEMVGFGMSEDELKRVISHPLVMIASDGTAVAPYGVLSKSTPHPRFYGTFPRVLGKYVREEKLLDLPTAIHKMSGMPAQRLGLKDRGRIDVGCAADVVVFNPQTIADQADFLDPHQYPVGIEYVLVNGTVVIKQGKHTGALPGKALRRA
ncbi:MAG: D-aminoacylase [Candidatus Latescibacteria bacterium]|nr:D-aminoacylase [Candidatus Latescibacterota bacterium]